MVKPEVKRWHFTKVAEKKLLKKFDKVSQIMAWHSSLNRRPSFDLFPLNWQWFTIYSVLSFILLSSILFLLLFSCKLLFSFLAFSWSLRGLEVLFKYNICSFWLLEKLPKVKGPFLMSHKSIWAFFPLFFWHEEKWRPEVWALPNPVNLGSKWWASTLLLHHWAVCLFEVWW